MIPAELKLDEWASDLENSTAEEIIAQAGKRFAPRLALATGFGPEGCLLIDLAVRHGVAIDVFTLDTGYLFPETYALWSRLEARYNITIRGLRPWLTEDAVEIEPGLYERDPDRCCDQRKVKPLRGELQRFDAWVTAIRRDQTADRATARPVEWDAKFGLVKVNPLVRWTSQQVWDYLRQNDVPTNPLHAHGYPSIGCAPCTTPVNAGEDPRAGRWRGRTKTECGLHTRPCDSPAAGE